MGYYEKKTYQERIKPTPVKGSRLVGKEATPQGFKKKDLGRGSQKRKSVRGVFPVGVRTGLGREKSSPGGDSHELNNQKGQSFTSWPKKSHGWRNAQYEKEDLAAIVGQNLVAAKQN